MANIELLAEITASGMYIFDYFTSPTQTVCLRIVYAETKKTAAYAEASVAVIEAWTSVALKQGPLDYEL